MIKNFPVQNGIVVARVVNAPNPYYFFAQNGDPAQIMCHINQGGEAVVSDSGRLQFVPFIDSLPIAGKNVVLIRESQNPAEKSYTKASRWITEENWNQVSWAVNANTTYRAVAYNHRTDGHFQGNTRESVELANDRLLEIAKKNPRQSNDPLGEKYSIEFAGHTLSYSVRWERLDGDGVWTECADPRPY